MASLPYVTSPGNIDKALKAIKSAATPDSVSQDFVKTILKIPGGSGNQITTLLKKLGFASADGKPSKRYSKFRNSATSGVAIAEAIREAYAPLYVRNEYMHSLSDKELKGLIVEETGAGDNSNVPSLVLAAINALKSHAEFTTESLQDVDDDPSDLPRLPPIQIPPEHNDSTEQSVGLNLSYTINLNLPPTSDIAVFNAIFKSLKENLLKEVR